MPEKEWVVDFVMRKAKEKDMGIEGPYETQYGWGWMPTDSIWKGERRIHFYIHSFEDRTLCMEIADLKLKRARRFLIGKPGEQNNKVAWWVTCEFLGKQCEWEDLDGLDWTEDNLDHDKFIPHPPNVDNPANIVSLIEMMKKAGAKEWKPNE